MVLADFRGCLQKLSKMVERMVKKWSPGDPIPFFDISFTIIQQFLDQNRKPKGSSGLRLPPPLGFRFGSKLVEGKGKGKGSWEKWEKGKGEGRDFWPGFH